MCTFHPTEIWFSSLRQADALQSNQSAQRLFSFLYGESILPSLGIQEIPANDINLTPRLLKK